MGDNPLIPAHAELRSAAQRMSDAVNIAVALGPDSAPGRYMAFSLADGSTDEVVYDTRNDAVRHTANKPGAYCYVCLTPDGMTVRVCERFLSGHRALYASGHRIPHPEDVGGLEIELPQRTEAWKQSGLILPGHLQPPPPNPLWRP